MLLQPLLITSLSIAGPLLEFLIIMLRNFHVLGLKIRPLKFPNLILQKSDFRFVLFFLPDFFFISSDSRFFLSDFHFFYIFLIEN